MAKNWDRAAMRFASAKYVDRQAMLDVTFENGDHFLVGVESILSGGGDVSKSRSGRAAMVSPRAWRRMRIGETGDVLEVPEDGTVIEIPWDRIRAIADPDFRAHLTERAHERAQHIGQRLRAMRLEAGLTPATLAQRVGVSQETIANLEMGKVEPDTDLIQHIAGVLGRRLRDFAG
jgi:DNA-binding XRE family transcriptional regulator